MAEMTAVKKGPHSGPFCCMVILFINPIGLPFLFDRREYFFGSRSPYHPSVAAFASEDMLGLEKLL